MLFCLFLFIFNSGYFFSQYITRFFQFVLHDVGLCTIQQQIHTCEGTDNLVNITCTCNLICHLELLLNLTREVTIVVAWRAEEHTAYNSDRCYNITAPQLAVGTYHHCQTSCFTSKTVTIAKDDSRIWAVCVKQHQVVVQWRILPCISIIVSRSTICKYRIVHAHAQQISIVGS